MSKRNKYEKNRKSDLNNACLGHDVTLPCLQPAEADQGFQVAII